MKRKIPGINYIGSAKAILFDLEKQEFLTPKSEVTTNVSFDNICFHGFAELEVETKIEGNEEVYISELNYFTTIEPITTDVQKVFLVATNSGDRFLIGTETKPYPRVTYKMTTGKSEKNSTGFDVTVSYTNRFPALKLKK